MRRLRRWRKAEFGALGSGEQSGRGDLRAVQGELRAIYSTLQEIKDHLRVLNGRIGEGEKWRAATEPVIEATIERVDEVTDKADKHQSYIDSQTGGATMGHAIFVSVVQTLGILAVLVKLLFFRN